MKLQGQVAIVTGAARGIGLAIAGSFQREGARVVIADLDAAAAEEAAAGLNAKVAGTALAVPVDVTVPGDSERLMAQTEAWFGAADLLVCNAGIVRPGAPIEEIAPETWDRVLGVNLMGCVYPTKAFVPAAKARGSGGIVYIASVAGQVGGVAAEMTYSVSKGGVLALNKAVARQLAPHGIRVNAIAPGAIRTGMTDTLDYPPSVRAGIPLGDYGDVPDIAEAAVYLASADSKYVTGATLDVNGGMFMR